MRSCNLEGIVAERLRLAGAEQAAVGAAMAPLDEAAIFLRELAIIRVRHRGLFTDNERLALSLSAIRPRNRAMAQREV